MQPDGHVGGPVAPAGNARASSGFRSARFARDYARWQCEYSRVRPDNNKLRLPEVLDEKPKAGMTRALLYEEDALSGMKEEALEQTKLERLHSELTELHANIAEVEAATERDLAAQPEAAMRRHNMRQAERARIQREIEELRARKDSANQALEALLASQAAEAESSRQSCETLEGEVAPLRAALEERRAEAQRLLERRRAQEARAAEEEAEVARLQAYADSLRKEIVAADFRRDRAEAEAASKRKVHRWGTLCILFLVHENERAWQLEVEEFEAAVSCSELAAGGEAPVSPRPDGFYAPARVQGGAACLAAPRDGLAGR